MWLVFWCNGTFSAGVAFKTNAIVSLKITLSFSCVIFALGGEGAEQGLAQYHKFSFVIADFL